MKPKAAYAVIRNDDMINRVYSPQTKSFLEAHLDFVKTFNNMEDLETFADEWKEVEYFFSTWGTPTLTTAQLEKHFPKLKAVFYGAGSVQYFARPYLERGIRIFTANEAMSIPVIEYTAAQIFLANKGYFQAVKLYGGGSWDAAKKYCSFFPGNEGTAAGIAGAGRIGKGVIAKLKAGRVQVNVFDPFLSAEEAGRLGVNKLETLEELFSASFVVSNHLANNDKTKGMIQYRHFALMHDYGVFINTGRGAQIEEEGLVRALKEKPTRTALLDVSWPEPVQKGHPFFTMNNVLISPHIAGTINNERIWLGEYIAEEFGAFLANKPLRSEVTEDMLLTMA
jgi:phosphoglycerate dehydrogenase-like enzyme